MTRSLVTLFVAVLVATTSAFVLADDRPDHYQGKPAETLEQAMANFAEYNQKLADILGKKELQAADMHKVHELTYTLENALEKIRDELEELAETLEDIHVASEHANIADVKKHGTVYLETARKIVK